MLGEEGGRGQLKYVFWFKAEGKLFTLSAVWFTGFEIQAAVAALSCWLAAPLLSCWLAWCGCKARQCSPPSGSPRRQL